MTSHNPHASVHATANSTNGQHNNHSKNLCAQLHQASSMPQDRGVLGGNCRSAGTGRAAAAQSVCVVRRFLPVENGSGPPSPPRAKGGLSPTSGEDGDKEMSYNK
ncbi:hypothetical protein VaNZ11_003903 [Volvox africanus]|uniref:Uncharacterized protein n=1 Tax=Volvox africanus TaxID=51714 RepID=A0ABQ5RW82_9CHLO|nr:hypothetical protein VaNZ11_003903 [Volvox africanus]